MATSEEVARRREKFMRDQAWQERMNQPSQYNRYQRHLANFEANQLAAAENQRQMEIQKLKNLGAVDVARTTGEGYAEQQKLLNIGQRDVTGMQQRGQTERENIRDRLGREKLMGEQYKTLRELEQNPLTPVGYSYIPGFQEYRETMLNEVPETTQRKYTPVTRADGTIEYYDSLTGKKAYTENPTLKDMPTELQRAPRTETTLQNLPALVQPVSEDIYGPEYRRAINPLSRGRSTRPITTTPLRDLFGDFKLSTNPRYR